MPRESPPPPSPPPLESVCLSTLSLCSALSICSLHCPAGRPVAYASRARPKTRPTRPMKTHSHGALRLRIATTASARPRRVASRCARHTTGTTTTFARANLGVRSRATTARIANVRRVTCAESAACRGARRHSTATRRHAPAANCAKALGTSRRASPGATPLTASRTAAPDAMSATASATASLARAAQRATWASRTARAGVRRATPRRTARCAHARCGLRGAPI